MPAGNASCPACGGRKTAFWFQKTNEHGAFEIHRCRDCASGFVLPRPTWEFLEKFYAGYDYGRDRNGHWPHSIKERLAQILEEERLFPNSTVDAKRIAADCRGLAVGTRFLDVGA